jgi:predicted  nucleic acid-binding Zn-ribbon protein
MAENDNRDGTRILVQVCISCGKEYFSDAQEPASMQSCEKCGGVVFRSFHADTNPDDVGRDYGDATDRNVATDDPATDVTRGDLHDLNNL